jgi:hypothetical protein
MLLSPTAAGDPARLSMARELFAWGSGLAGRGFCRCHGVGALARCGTWWAGSNLSSKFTAVLTRRPLNTDRARFCESHHAPSKHCVAVLLTHAFAAGAAAAAAGRISSPQTASSLPLASHSSHKVRPSPHCAPHLMTSACQSVWATAAWCCCRLLQPS